MKETIQFDEVGCQLRSHCIGDPTIYIHVFKSQLLNNLLLHLWPGETNPSHRRPRSHRAKTKPSRSTMRPFFFLESSQILLTSLPQRDNALPKRWKEILAPKGTLVVQMVVSRSLCWAHHSTGRKKKKKEGRKKKSVCCWLPFSSPIKRYTHAHANR